MKGGYGPWGGKGQKGGKDTEPTPSDNLYVWQLPLDADEAFLAGLFQEVGTVVSVKTTPGSKYGFVRLGSVDEAAAAIAALNGLELPNTTLKLKFADNGKGSGKSAWAATAPSQGAWAAAAPSQGAWGATAPSQSQSGKGMGKLLTPKVVAPPGASRYVDHQAGVGFQGASGYGGHPRGGEPEAAPSDNLYVWQLPMESDEAFLRELFEQVGTVVSVKYVPEKRYGFVKFSSVDEAALALQEVNGLECNGTTIRVKFADNPKGQSKGVDLSQQAFGGYPAYSAVQAPAPLQTPSSIRIFVEDLPPGLSGHDVATIFNRYCSGCECQVFSDSCGPIAVVHVLDWSEAEYIVANLNGNIPQGLNAPVRLSMAQYTDAPPRKVPSPYGKAAGKAASAPRNSYSPYSKPVAESFDPNNTNLYVYQLPQGTDEGRLRQLFETCGSIVSLKCVTEKRYGFVKFQTVEEAQFAIDSVNGMHMEGTTIIAQYKT